ncbi:MAG: transcription termination factor Rho [Lachnospiraceae bacterium]|nr:transcription termination factor Rho [Lachnospiraceae bacterium]MDD6505270.1 transcription termination factor Rho [Lachnospiraceae bacterium]
MREKYESLSLAVLKDLAKARGIKGVSTMKKEALVERMLEEDERDKAKAAGKNKAKEPDREVTESAKESDKSGEAAPSENVVKEEIASLDSGNAVTGILEVLADGYGFLRSDNFMPGENDVYVSPSQIRRFNMKTGDVVSGNTRIKTEREKFSALLYVTAINGANPNDNQRRPNFEDLTPIFPDERLRLERQGASVAMRVVDLISPIGKGQRGMIVSQPKAGKTTLLKEVAKSVLANNPEMHLIILLIDERPEEVTDIKESIVSDNVEVIYSTFDELPEHHRRVSEMVIERAKRLVEHKQDVMILLDSITRLARAYNLTVQPSGRTLSGGLDPAALHMPKRFFGAARNMREGGSLTILATALVDTGSKMDDVVYEEFKGTGNMELVLDRKLSEKRIFPAVDIVKSGTRREDLLLDDDELAAVEVMRRAFNGARSEEAVENILNMFAHTKNNHEFINMVRKNRIF